MIGELEIRTALDSIAKNKPLVHNITNWVTIYDVAQAVRSCGALPVMAHSSNEVSDMVKISSALCLNIGTLDQTLIESMLIAGKAANQKGIPIILDCVGAGATPYRTEAVRELLSKLKVQVIKGNSAEIAIVAGCSAEVRGVEAMAVQGDLSAAMRSLASSKDCTAVATGEVDRVVSGQSSYLVRNGSREMGLVVGTGCMSTGVIGAFCAIAAQKDYALASALALSYYGLAGELASKSSKQPMEFKQRFMDALYYLANGAELKGAKIEKQ